MSLTIQACVPDVQQRLWPGDRIQGLYVHIPFCFHKCHYCDFYSIVVEPGQLPGQLFDRQKSLTDRLIGELTLRVKQVGVKPRTLFFGGGTPTLLEPILWTKILTKMSDLGVLADLAELTVEANPETVTAQLLAILVGGGVNRLSIGCQSFNEVHLKTLERWHDPANVARSVKLARAAGIGNINLDLIHAIPGQTLADVDDDLDKALALEPEHVSCYSLTYEPHTAMTQKLQMGKISSVPEELERAMYDRVMTRLAQAGYEQYEISNWALSGRACLHNMQYWTNANWLGIGPGAASHISGHRWKNEPHLGHYLAGDLPPIVEDEKLSQPRRVGERLMLGLRLTQGIGLDWLDEHLSSNDFRHAIFKQMIQSKLMERTDTHLRLTREGLFVADGIVGQLL